MIVYLDVLIFENFVVDLFLLKLTKKLIRVRTSKVRLMIAAMFGALYTVTLVFENTSFFTKRFVQVIMAFIIISLSFNKSNLFTKVKGTLCYIALSMIFSGLCIYLSSEKNNMLSSNLKNIIMSIIILNLLLERLIQYVKERIFVTNYIYELEIINNGEKYHIKGFLDTGNELREPLTNYPCILVEESKISSFDMNNCYYINYSSVGHNGKIRGVKCESVRIKAKDGAWQEVDVIICPCQNEKFSKENDFNALMPRGII
ncbi:MAG: sigma-E processing peptidase SpoIIGA [Clostridium sp.]|nr:sigma-E processing peptidase SpoIIGA [Clostridium sp.]MDY3827645.1 sigma-E processing peptidase SpoIIGA [Clostridium sp.]